MQGMKLEFDGRRRRDLASWHSDVLKYKHLVDRWTCYFWGINHSFLYSFEDLEQTVWYILMVGLEEFSGKGDEEKFLHWYVRNKLVSIIMYRKHPPKCQDAPFTPMRLDYVSPDDSPDVMQLFYSDGHSGED